MLQGSPPHPNITKTQIRKCSLCGIEGHNKANNKTFHPDGNLNAKVGIARSSKKSAVAKPKRNVGKIDDERYQLVDIVDGSDEVEDASDTEDQEVWGLEGLNWSRNLNAHDLVQPGPGDKFGHPVPKFQGSDPGIFLGDIADIDPNEDWMTVLSFFFTQGYTFLVET